MTTEQVEMQSETVSDQGEEVMSPKVVDEWARARAAQEAAVEEEAKLNAYISSLREDAREEWANSEQGAVAAQIAESERIMRLPTPEAHKVLGSGIPNPLKGPSS